MKRTLFGGAAALLVSLTAVSVWAQSDDDLKRAQAHFAKGAEEFAGGEYAKAVVQFTSGHALAPNAMFLYNVSLCYERLGRIEDALGAAKRATEFDGMPPEVVQRNDGRIGGFTVALSTLNRAKSAAASVPEQVVQVEPQTVTQPDGITTLGWVGLGLVAVGGGFVVGGVATNSAIVKEIETYEAAGQIGDSVAYNTSRDAIEKKQSQGKLFYGIGFGAVGLGAALFVVDLVTGTEEVPVALVPLSDGAMVHARFSF